MKRLIILALATFLAAPYTLEAAKKKKAPKATWGSGKRAPAKKRPVTKHVIVDHSRGR
jgi:hypothetical protein